MNGGVEINSSEKVAYAVYTVSGAIVARGNVDGFTSVKLDGGIYLVKAGNTVAKVVVK